MTVTIIQAPDSSPPIHGPNGLRGPIHRKGIASDRAVGEKTSLVMFISGNLAVWLRRRLGIMSRHVSRVPEATDINPTTAILSVRSFWHDLQSSNQRCQLCPNFSQFRGSDLPLACRLTRPPILALHLVRQHDTRRLPGKRHLERVALDPRGRRTADNHAGPAIVAGGTENDGLAVPRLLVTGLRIELQPDDVSRIGHVDSRRYQTSCPTAGPLSIASCRFSSVIAATSAVMS